MSIALGWTVLSLMVLAFIIFIIYFFPILRDLLNKCKGCNSRMTYIRVKVTRIPEHPSLLRSKKWRGCLNCRHEETIKHWQNYIG